ncbi:MAG: hypothetical protein FJ293_05250 [Planctomycetes bacterium]|nr:hypothetical protein [Planctomycetota bacterium]
MVLELLLDQWLDVACQSDLAAAPGEDRGVRDRPMAGIDHHAAHERASIVGTRRRRRRRTIGRRRQFLRAFVGARAEDRITCGCDVGPRDLWALIREQRRDPDASGDRRHQQQGNELPNSDA